MGLVAHEPDGGEFVKVSPGTHPARCIAVIDLGEQYSQFYDKTSHKVLITWEVPGETDDKGAPLKIGKRYTMSLHERAALRQHLEAWRGRSFTDDELKGFDLSTIIGVPCMLNVKHVEDGKYANVTSVMACPKGFDLPPQHHERVVYAVEDGENDVFRSFSEKMQVTIRAGMTGHSSMSTRDESEAGIPDDDEIPF